MSGLPGLLGTKRKVVLGDGRASGWWQRQLAQRLKHLSDLRRLSTWLKGLIITPPKLRDEPLLGHCLAELVDQKTSPAGLPERRQSGLRKASEPAHQASRTPTLPSLYSQKGATPARKRLEAVEPSRFSPPLPVHPSRPIEADQQSPLPFRLAPTADQTLLHRLAGNPVLSSSQLSGEVGPLRRRPLSKLFPPTIQLEDLPRRDHRSPERRQLPSIPANTVETRLAWLRTLAQRARQSLYQNGIEALPQAEILVGPASSSTLTDLWRVPSEGQTVSLELLARLTNLSPGGKVSASSRISEPMALNKDRNDSPQTAGKRTMRSLSSSAAINKDESRSTGEPVGLGLATSSNGAGQGETVGPGARSAIQVAPPHMAPTLPPLLIPRVATEPSLTVTTATIRQEAKQEISPAEEDLTVLAAKVKRILDEEARRYGIEV